ncbi:tRNA cytosine(34) acetyltransferase TmcA [Mannheimia granulomatis]|uniref:tRNA(Met) cytidine acetyltransferase TmcA n=1 Tax=Mannheimia granulomatis TaxID=85402 RepID=A0A6G8JHL6_9PAST|nr:GNAT family N-acetyltransferase [Mannheimia granulomatis]QIM66675.1 tRNA cytosine(34) acetyltransferase TmcA [Mannheimia granulomatis]
MRALVIVTDHKKLSIELNAQGGYFYLPDTVQQINAFPFNNAKAILGREYPFAIYDMRSENGVNFNLEAFAILAGTIQENGTLFLLCPGWDRLEQEKDFDALRWNENNAIACPNFYQHFKKLAEKFGFQIQTSPIELTTSGYFSAKSCSFDLTPEQQKILQNLPLDLADIHLITAPRGRGKSTLAGLLASELAKQHKVLITAPSLAVLPSFLRSLANEEIPFFAPDNLLEQVQQLKISRHQWLFVDEAASLPLPMLNRLCHYFDKVVLTTTTYNYEGTGRGFSFKFLPQLSRSNKHWQLTKPLRWAENDPLEQFVNELLLLEESEQSSDLANFYQLLAHAHYKTTPTDLRRLFDGEQQILHQKYQDEQLIGGIWAVNEGNLDENLTQAIWQGKRRPQGSLVAQYLCFQGNLPQACQLHSVRISRIAVKPEMQNQGIGKRLVSDFILQISEKKQPLDFISVSFGLTELLYRFWSACGFRLVQVTPNKEASSGYRSAMMIYPLSAQGEQFCQEAVQAFRRNFALQPFFSVICADLQNFCQFQPLAELNLSDADWQNLQGFVEQQRTFSAVYVSLKRLYHSDRQKLAFLDNIFEQENAESLKQPKSWLENCRKILQEQLNFKTH